MSAINDTRAINLKIPKEVYYEIKRMADNDSRKLPKKKSIATKIIEILKQSI